jgi:prepilin-type N-terminal cleavage/methylation domain-containing protein
MIMKKRGFTLVELMVVMAMTAIMISVTIVSLSGSRDRKVVEGEARKFAAVVREAQNYALTGKQFISGRVTCRVGISDIASLDETYDVSYTYRSGADCTAAPSSAVFVTNTLSSGVTFSSTTSAFNFSVPRGETGLGSTLQVQLNKGSATYSVCIYRTGRVEEQMGSGACPNE